MPEPKYTLGVEEEYQIIDPKTRDLTSYVQEFLDHARIHSRGDIKPEFLQSQVEVGSRICADVEEVRSELVRLRREISEVAASKGLVIVAASTHPFSKWMDQQITSAARYTKHVEVMAEVARRMLIFGMHVHVGIEDRELRIDVMDQARYFLPHLLALSTSSPFWHGRETGLKSYRSIVFESLPRTGPPPSFGSWSEYERFLDTLIKTGCIDEPTKIWWDARPHPSFPTLEFRVCDICTTIDEAVCLAGLIQAIVAKLIKLRRSNMSWRRYRHHLVTENKWRAVRWGIDGNLIDFGKQAEVPMRQLAEELLEFVDDVVDDLGSRHAVEHLHGILANGTSADRQLRVYRETGSLEKVVDYLIEETRKGL